MSISTPSPQRGHRLDSSDSVIVRDPLRPETKVEEPACKPDSVPPGPRPAGGDHLSGSRVAAALVQPTREHRAGHPLPAWPCSGWGLPSRPVARPLVSSYLTVSPLPLLRPSPRGTEAARTPGSEAVGGLSLWHFPRVAPPGCYPASCPVESGLSSIRTRSETRSEPRAP